MSTLYFNYFHFYSFVLTNTFKVLICAHENTNPTQNMQETNDRLNFNCGRVEYENSKLQIENQGYDSVIEEIKAWNFWQRLKFLFKGKK